MPSRDESPRPVLSRRARAGRLLVALSGGAIVAALVLWVARAFLLSRALESANAHAPGLACDPCFLVLGPGPQLGLIVLVTGAFGLTTALLYRLLGKPSRRRPA